MSDLAIRIAGLSKCYRLGSRQGASSYKTLREALCWRIDILRARLTRRAEQEPTTKDFWALKDVSCDVKQGEVVGIIGRNGAGKSTLLKILSRITEPTAGHVELRGRVGSLLEVGTGFHPELTGRENIYMNGALLGMRRLEIQQKFDEIVAFAEVEQFLDTPVKRYSSGMYVRLAFAVAAHLEPEILLVDEVLAVGDAQFQKKCLGKMGEVARAGRTIFFVSHNMGAIARLCSTSVLLNRGQIQAVGAVDDVIAQYLREGCEMPGEICWDKPEMAPGNDELRLRGVALRTLTGEVATQFDGRAPIQVEIAYQIQRPGLAARICFRLLTSDGTTVFQACDSMAPSWSESERQAGNYVSRCTIPGNLLNQGAYTLELSADVPFVKILFSEIAAVSFEVFESFKDGHTRSESWPGVVNPLFEWQIARSPARGSNP